MVRKVTDEEHRMIMEMHQAFMRLPPGAGKNDKPLIEEIRAVVKTHQRASWATRAFIWAIPTLALLGASLQSILKWFGK